MDATSLSMPKLNVRPPRMCRKRSNDTAYVCDDGQKLYLGKWGTQEAYIAYVEYVKRWSLKRLQYAPLNRSRRECSLRELLDRFVEEYASQPNFSPSDLGCYRLVSSEIQEMFADLPANEFTPMDLEALRSAFAAKKFVRGGKVCRRSRQYLNKLVNRTRSIFSWGVGKGLVAPAVYQALTYVRALRAGRTSAPESRKHRLVTEVEIEAVLPNLPPLYVDVVKILRITGMRPSELCRLKKSCIDTSRDVWLYLPDRHKTSGSGKTRIIALGRRSQAVLSPYLATSEDEEYIFNPRLSVYLANKRRVRQDATETGNRQKECKDLTYFADQLNVHTLGRALSRACKRAIKAGSLRESWTLYDLRHTAITEVRARDGAEAAQHYAGHSQLETQRYYDHSAEVVITDLARRYG